MTFIANTSSSKPLKLLQIRAYRIKPTGYIVEEFTTPSLDYNGVLINTAGTKITIKLKAGMEYYIETQSNINSRITDVTSNDPDLVIKKNFDNSYLGFAAFYLTSDTEIYLTQIPKSYNTAFAEHTITSAVIYVYGV